MTISYEANSSATMPRYEYRNLTGDEKLVELKKAFAYNCKKIDFFRGPDGYSYCLGSIGKSEDDPNTEYRVFRTLRGVSGNKENEVDYIFTSFSKSEAIQALNSMQGTRVVEERQALNLIKTYTEVDNTDVMEKNLKVMNGDGDWKQIHGEKVFVGKDGTIIRGSDVFIGRSFKEVENLFNADTFGAQRSVGRATFATNKALEIENDTTIRR